MKTTIKTLLIILFPAFIFAQKAQIEKFNIEIGKPYEVIDAYLKEYFYKDNTILAFKVNKKGLTIQKFDASTLRLESSKLYADYKGYFVPEGIMEYNDRFLLFYSVWDKKNEKEQLFFREVDLKTGTFKDKGKLLLSVKGKLTGELAGTGKLYGIQVVNKFKISTSYDDSKMLVWYRRHPINRSDANNKDRIGFSIFDTELNMLWDKEVRMPYTEKRMDNIDYYVNPAGDVFILTTVFKGSSSQKKLVNGKTNYNINIIKIQPDKDDIEQFTANLEGNLINSISLFQSNPEYLILGGFFTNSKKGLDDAKGIFYIKMDNDGTVINEVKYDFPPDLLNQNASNKTKKKNNKKEEKAQLANLSMTKIVMEEDGSMVLIGEQFWVDYMTKMDSKSPRMDVYSMYGYMIAAKITSNGDLAWIKKLPKAQKGKNTGMKDMSFSHFTNNNNHYFLFMDNAANLHIDMAEKPKVHRAGAEGYLTQYKINSTTGEVTKGHLFNSKEVKGMPIYQFTASRIISNDNGEFIIEVYKKKKQDILIKATSK